MPQVTPIAGMPLACAPTTSNERSPTITARVGAEARERAAERLGLVLGACVRSGPATTLEVLAQPDRASSSGSANACGLEVATASRWPASASSASGMPGSTVVSVSDAVAVALAVAVDAGGDDRRVVAAARAARRTRSANGGPM